MKLKKIAALLLAAGLAAGLCACGQDNAGADTSAEGSSASSTESAASSESGASSESSTEASGELTEIDVVLDWYPNAIHTFLYEAIDNGYFEEAGLSVNLISPAQSVDAITFVASGKAQIGLTYPVEIAQAAESDMPVKALASVCAKQLDCLCALSSNTDITSDMTSLKGKKVGYAGTTLSEATIRTITRDAGLADDDYELIDVGFDLVTSLTTGSVDLVVGTFLNDEVVTMEQAGYELNIFEEADYGFPDMYGVVMAVNSDDYEANKEIYEAFLNACEQGYADMTADEDDALELIMSEMNSDDNPLDEEQQRQSYEILMEKMASEEEPFLSMSEEKWQNILDWMQEAGLIETELTAADVTADPANLK